MLGVSGEGVGEGCKYSQEEADHLERVRRDVGEDGVERVTEEHDECDADGEQLEAEAGVSCGDLLGLAALTEC